jgi:hypothetical protein
MSQQRCKSERESGGRKSALFIGNVDDVVLGDRETCPPKEDVGEGTDCY